MTRALSATLALLLGAAPAARADELVEAKASFRRGVELYRERRWQEAVEQFQAAYLAKPHGALHFNVAQCRERLDDWPGAIRSYHDYLREVPGATDRDAVRAEVRRLEARLAAAGVQVLLVDSTPPGARVAVEGLDRGATPLHVVLRPGTYAVALTLDGHAPWTHRVEVGGPASVALDAELKPLPGARGAPGADLAPRPPAAGASLPIPPPARPRRYLPAWIAGGTAVAATAAALAFGASARADERAADASPDGAGASARASRAASKRRTARVLTGVAGGAAVAGATLFLLEWKF